jgi:hypothetical protein
MGLGGGGFGAGGAGGGGVPRRSLRRGWERGAGQRRGGTSTVGGGQTTESIVRMLLDTWREPCRVAH